MFVVLAQPLLVRCVVVGDKDGVIFDAYIAFQRAKNFSSQMCDIPLGKRLSQSLGHLMNGRLGQQGHAHLPVADIEIERTSPMPTQGLVEFKKLLDVPALWIVNC